MQNGKSWGPPPAHTNRTINVPVSLLRDWDTLFRTQVMSFARIEYVADAIRAISKDTTIDQTTRDLLVQELTQDLGSELTSLNFPTFRGWANLLLLRRDDVLRTTRKSPAFQDFCRVGPLFDRKLFGGHTLVFKQYQKRLQKQNPFLALDNRARGTARASSFAGRTQQPRSHSLKGPRQNPNTRGRKRGREPPSQGVKRSKSDDKVRYSPPTASNRFSRQENRARPPQHTTRTPKGVQGKSPQRPVGKGRARAFPKHR